MSRNCFIFGLMFLYSGMLYADEIPPKFLFSIKKTEHIPSHSTKKTRIYMVMGIGYRSYFIRPWKKNYPYVTAIPNSLQEYLADHHTYSKTLKGSKGGKVLDLLYTLKWGYQVRENIQGDRRSMRFIKGLRKDLNKNPLKKEQLNIMGISQGCIPIAQSLIKILKNPTKYGFSEDLYVDNLVLVGCPIAKNSELYKELLTFEGDGKGKIRKIHYDNYQSENDIVTGSCGVNKQEAKKNAKIFMKTVLSKKGKNIPHMRAADNKPIPNDSICNCTFSDQLKIKIVNDSIH